MVENAHFVGLPGGVENAKVLTSPKNELFQIDVRTFSEARSP
jgi:hypothetical protein